MVFGGAGDEDAAFAEGGERLGGGVHHRTHGRSILRELGAEECDGCVGGHIGAPGGLDDGAVLVAHFVGAFDVAEELAAFLCDLEIDKTLAALTFAGMIPSRISGKCVEGKLRWASREIGCA